MKAKERQNEHDHYDQAYKINQTVHDCLPGGAILQPLTATSPDKFHIVNRANGRGYPPLSLRLGGQFSSEIELKLPRIVGCDRPLGARGVVMATGEAV